MDTSAASPLSLSRLSSFIGATTGASSQPETRERERERPSVEVVAAARLVRDLWRPVLISKRKGEERRGPTSAGKEYGIFVKEFGERRRRRRDN